MEPFLIAFELKKKKTGKILLKTFKSLENFRDTS